MAGDPLSKLSNFPDGLYVQEPAWGGGMGQRFLRSKLFFSLLLTGKAEDTGSCQGSSRAVHLNVPGTHWAALSIPMPCPSLLGLW